MVKNFVSSVQGQWSKVPDCDGTGMAERSYPSFEVRGGDEELPHV